MIPARLWRVMLVLLMSAALSACGGAPTSERESVVATNAADYPLLPLDLLLAPMSYLAPQISPDGRKISWIAPHNETANLFVADVDDLGSARPITNFTGNGVVASDVSGKVLYRWHYDSNQILFPMDYAGDENFDIHIVDVASGRERNLTPTPEQRVQIIAYGRAQPNELLVSAETFGQGNPDVYQLNLVNGESTLVQKNDGALLYLADNDLRLRFRVDYTSEGGLALYQFSPQGRGKLVYQVAPADLPAISASGYQGVTRFDARNEKLYLYDLKNRDKTALVAIDAETGAVELLAEDDRVDIGGVLFNPLTQQPQAYATHWTELSWQPIDPAIAPHLEALEQLADGNLEVVSRADDDSSWIVQYNASDQPTVYYRYTPADKTAQKLFTSTPQLEGLALSKMHPYVYRTEDGFDLVSYITLPPWTDPDGDGRPDQPVPVVVYVHGGPSDERAQMGFGALVHWLANRGYGFQFVNFRGSAGFGKAYMNAQKMEWGGKMHRDVLDQVQWAIDQGIADPDRVAIFGGSYGGYEALVGMTMTPDVFACGVAVVGPANLEIFMPHWNPDTMGKVIGDPRTEEGRAFLRSRSPINFAQQTKNPVLIGQGANDSRVPQAQSDTVVEKMQAAGVDVSYVVFPDEGHGFVKQANNMAFYGVTEAFLSACLDGRHEEIGTKLEGSSMQVPVGAEHIPGLVEALEQRDR